MSCGERLLSHRVLASGPSGAPASADSSSLNRGNKLAWYKRLPGRVSRQPCLKPLHGNKKAPTLNERNASGQNGRDELSPAGNECHMEGASSTKSRAKTSKTKPGDRTNSKKENSGGASRTQNVMSETPRLKERFRMSYPPYIGTRQQLDPVLVMKSANSCPVLCDVENRTVTLPKRQPIFENVEDRPGTTSSQKTKHDALTKHGEHSQTSGLSPNNGKLRHRNTRKFHGEMKTRRPKPPSWQDLAEERQTSRKRTGYRESASSRSAVSELDSIVSPYRCDSATTRSIAVESASSDKRAAVPVRARIRRTRSRVIDSTEIPLTEVVLPLSQTKSSEFQLRKTYHDDTVYLLENARRCRQWLAAVEECDRTPHVHTLNQFAEGNYVHREEEIMHDEWNVLHSPYPPSSECSSGDD